MGQRKGFRHTEESKAKISETERAKVISPETRAKLSESHKRCWQDPEYRTKMSEIRKELWQDHEWKDTQIKNMRSGLHIHPNKSEMAILAMLDMIAPNEWEFVGNGNKLIIEGKNPDFTNINGQKKLIEMWGTYWHKGQDPQDRLDIFKKYGYDTLIVWESELKNPEEVLSRLMDFTQKYHSSKPIHL